MQIWKLSFDNFGIINLGHVKGSFYNLLRYWAAQIIMFMKGFFNDIDILK